MALGGGSGISLGDDDAMKTILNQKERLKYNFAAQYTCTFTSRKKSSTIKVIFSILDNRAKQRCIEHEVV